MLGYDLQECKILHLTAGTAADDKNAQKIGALFSHSVHTSSSVSFVKASVDAPLHSEGLFF